MYTLSLRLLFAYKLPQRVAHKLSYNVQSLAQILVALEVVNEASSHVAVFQPRGFDEAALIDITSAFRQYLTC
jgi:hypothetical protein